MSQHFPDNFLWGASSSAFQIEGGWDEDGKGMTVADYNSFKRSDKQADSKVASDFYHHWKEDIDLMKEMGMKAYRFSLSWARIIPDGDGEVNQKGLDFYNQVINYLIEQGIQPLVTLYHFDLPYALVEKYNGWECRDCAFAFERYARVCYKAFGDRVKYWQMINEQNLMIRVNERMNIYVEDDWEADRMRAQMDYHMFLGHALAVNACHELVEGGKEALVGGGVEWEAHGGPPAASLGDVGKGLLDYKLRQDERVVVMDRTNARYLEPQDFRGPVDLISMDLSFISLRLVLPAAKRLLQPQGRIVPLIKPQFEAGPEKLGKGGVVRNPEVHVQVLEGFWDFCQAEGLALYGLTFSPIKGPAGNIEYLACLGLLGSTLRAGEEEFPRQGIRALVAQAWEKAQ